MSNHMQEPWPRFIDICQPSTPIPDSEPVVLLGFDDYRRAKACVNRFAGLSTEFIESGFDIISIIKQRDELLEALQGMVDIASDSQGVAGWHLNGAVADWDEFEEWQAACDAIAKTKCGAVNHFPYAAKMVPDGWKLVPVAATKDMWAAWDSAPCNNEDDAVNLEAAYSAMLAASPKFEGGAA